MVFGGGDVLPRDVVAGVREDVVLHGKAAIVREGHDAHDVNARARVGHVGWWRGLARHIKRLGGNVDADQRTHSNWVHSSYANSELCVGWEIVCLHLCAASVE